MKSRFTILYICLVLAVCCCGVFSATLTAEEPSKNLPSANSPTEAPVAETPPVAKQESANEDAAHSQLPSGDIPGLAPDHLVSHGATDESGKVSEVRPAVATLKDRYLGINNPDRRLDSVVQLGENLTYLAKWNGIPAGTISLKVWPTKRRVRDREAFLFELHSESNDFLSVFYEINSTIKSYADIATARSYLFRRSLREGRYRANDRLLFDYDHKDDEGMVAPVSRFARIRPDHVAAKEPLQIPGNLQDPLSIVYYLRHFDFTGVGTQHNVLMGTRRSTSLVQLTTIAEERIHLPQLGTFDCTVVEPKGDENADEDSLAKTKGYAHVWLEKNTRIPLMATVAIPIGKAAASLVSAENCILTKYRIAPPTESAESVPVTTAKDSESEQAADPEDLN